KAARALQQQVCIDLLPTCRQRVAGMNNGNMPPINNQVFPSLLYFSAKCAMRGIKLGQVSHGRQVSSGLIDGNHFKGIPVRRLMERTQYAAANATITIDR